MTWEEALQDRALLAVLDDLEQQASGLHLAERDAEVAEMSAAEYARVALAGRWHASLGRDVQLRLVGGPRLVGRLARFGEGWVLLDTPTGEHVVPTSGVLSAVGLSERSDHESTWSVVDRLSLRTVLRRLADAGEPCVLHLRDGEQLRGRLARVGLDFLELLTGEGSTGTRHVVPFAGLGSLRAAS